MQNFEPKQILVSFNAKPDGLGYTSVTFTIRNTSPYPIYCISVRYGYTEGSYHGGLLYPIYFNDGNILVGTNGNPFTEADKVVHSGNTKVFKYQCNIVGSGRVTHGTLEGTVNGHKFKTEFGQSPSECFVTTAVYTDPHHPIVEIFRAYRDKVLINFKVGRNFIELYNQHGPTAAKVVRKHPALQFAARAILTPVALTLRIVYKTHRLGE